MCYSNSSTSSNESLSKIYSKDVSALPEFNPLFYASGFTFPTWRVVTQSPQMNLMRWGLIPHWFSGLNPEEMASKTLNARVESLAEKASFKSLTTKNRCIIPSSGFFEFQTRGKDKIPYFIYPRQHEVFSMAGLYDEWLHRQTGEIIYSFSIITTEANALMADIHNVKKRMPLILPMDDVSNFVKGQQPITSFTSLQETEMAAHLVNKHVLLSTNANTPEVQQRIVDNIGTQGSLF